MASSFSFNLHSINRFILTSYVNLSNTFNPLNFIFNKLTAIKIDATCSSIGITFIFSVLLIEAVTSTVGTPDSYSIYICFKLISL